MTTRSDHRPPLRSLAVDIQRIVEELETDEGVQDEEAILQRLYAIARALWKEISETRPLPTLPSDATRQALPRGVIRVPPWFSWGPFFPVRSFNNEMLDPRDHTRRLIHRFPHCAELCDDFSARFATPETLWFDILKDEATCATHMERLEPAAALS